MVEKELGIKEKDFWFKTKEERSAFKTKLKVVADKHRVIIAFKEEGNYSCDCNKSLFLSREHPEIEEMDCGDEIQLKNFTVTLEA